MNGYLTAPTLADFFSQPDDDEQMTASDLRHATMRKMRITHLMDPE